MSKVSANFWFHFFKPLNRPENTEYNSLMLTYKNIDKKTFFSIPVHFRTIDDIIKELEKPTELKWPSRAEKEVDHQYASKRWIKTKIYRKWNEFLFFWFSLQLHIDRKTIPLDVSAGPICKFSASRSLACTMELNIAPSCLLINGFGFEIFIIEPQSEKECSIPSNYIIVPMAFQVDYMQTANKICAKILIGLYMYWLVVGIFH